MDFGITSKTNEYLANLYQKNKTAGAADSTSFLSAISAKAAEKTESASFEEMLKSKYPGAYYNVMDTSKIDRGLWGRNDYPWDAYFSEPADGSVLNWTPSGPEPNMQSPEVQAKINSMAGKMSIVIPPELEEKMKNNPELAGQVMDNIDGFIAKYYRPEANQGFLITFDENGEINNACIACEGRITVSSSEFVEARKAREAKHVEYERIAEENAIKRKLQQQMAEEKYYRNSIRQGGQESYDAVLQRREQLKNEKISLTDYGYEIQKRAAQQNDVDKIEGSALSTIDKANSYVKAYAELYDEIVQGYENGTREIYAADENGTHKLTKDEELSALDEAYKKTVDDFVTMEKTNQHAREIINGEMEKISKISSRSTLASIYLEERKTKGTDDIPENLNEKMYHAIVSFKEQYTMYNPKADNLSQLLMNVKIS